MREKNFSPLLTYIFAIYAASLIIANILANHMLAIGPFTSSAGIITFPVTYILASVLAEVYGYKWARRAAWTSLALTAFLAGMISLAIILPQPGWYADSRGTVFADAVGGSWRIVLASLTAFGIGKYINDNLFKYLKGKHEGKGFAFRAMASSAVGHLFDTSIFSFVAFAWTGMPWSDLFWMIPVGSGLKWGYEWLALPLTVRLKDMAKAKEERYAGLDNGNE
jgi:hypothetical protein